MFLGSAQILGALDPYSIFGRFISVIKGNFNLSLVLQTVVTFGIILALVLWKGRFYCTTICPVGCILGFFAKKNFYKIIISEKCKKCKTCEIVCPAGCIDVDLYKVDSQRCLRCLKCISVCPLGGIDIKRKGTGK